MSTFDFINPDNGQRIVVRGPATLTREQAHRVFEQQRVAGALVSLKPGESITAESQLAGGLVAAQAEVLQSVAQNPAGFSKPGPVRVISDALKATPDLSLTVDTAEYAKQQPALTSVGKLSTVELTGVLAQFKNLSPQPAAVATPQGVGEFDLTPAQLEAQGYLKPGTVATYFSDSRNSILTVLRSPRVWTGKNTVYSLQQLLANSELQQTIQETAMQTGFSSLAEVGLPVDQLPARAQAGVALSAARDAAATEAWLSGQTVDNDLKTKFNEYVRYSAYAVDFSDTKTNDSLRRQEPAQVAFGTTQREQIDAAVTRIIGNKKVTPPTFSQIATDPALINLYDRYQNQYEQLLDRLTTVEQQTVSVQNISARESQINSVDLQAQTLVADLQNLQSTTVQTAPTATDLAQRIAQLLIDAKNLLERTQQSKLLIQRIKTQFQLQ